MLEMTWRLLSQRIRPGLLFVWKVVLVQSMDRIRLGNSTSIVRFLRVIGQMRAGSRLLGSEGGGAMIQRGVKSR